MNFLPEEYAMPDGDACKPSNDVLIEGMIKMCSHLMHCGVQACLLAVNIECKEFLSLNEFLYEQQCQHNKDFAKMAEKVRSMDYLLPMCQDGLLGAFPDFSKTDTYETYPAITNYMKNLEEGGFFAKDGWKMACAAEAPDIAACYSKIAGHSFDGAWHLKAMLR